MEFLKDDSILVVSLINSPVNVLTRQCLLGLTELLGLANQQTSLRAILLKSGLQRSKVFSAGFDLKEFQRPESFKEYKVIFETFFLKLYSTELTTMVLYDGYSPGAGCFLGLCTEYRLATQNSVIGLNEVTFNVHIPKFWPEVLTQIIGFRLAERLCLSGSMLSANKAQEIGLVDHVCQDQSQLFQVGIKILEKQIDLPRRAQFMTKRQLREDFVARWFQSIEIMAIEDSKLILNPDVQRAIAKLLRPKSKL